MMKPIWKARAQPQNPPTQQPDPQQPPRPEYWIVDGQVRERSSFSRMAEAKDERDGMGYDAALAQLREGDAIAPAGLPRAGLRRTCCGWPGSRRHRQDCW